MTPCDPRAAGPPPCVSGSSHAVCTGSGLTGRAVCAHNQTPRTPSPRRPSLPPPPTRQVQRLCGACLPGGEQVRLPLGRQHCWWLCVPPGRVVKGVSCLPPGPLLLHTPHLSHRPQKFISHSRGFGSKIKACRVRVRVSWFLDGFLLP